MSANQPATPFTRRTFIKAAGTMGVTVYVLWSNPAWLGPRIALAANLSTLNAAQAKAMLTMARQLFPHDKRDHGKVTGVVYADEARRRCTCKRRASSAWPATRSRARACCSTRLRARSPTGMANSSGQVGRNYTRHASQHGHATFEKTGQRAPRHPRARDHAQRSRATIPRAASRAAIFWRSSTSALPFTALSVVPGAWGRKVSSATSSSSITWSRYLDLRGGPAAGRGSRVTRTLP